MKLLQGLFRKGLALGALIVAPIYCVAADVDEDTWKLSGQTTYIYQRKGPFAAAYTNLNGSPNSLLPDKERSYTFTATAFLGFKPWADGEVFVVPEAISMLSLSGLRGLGGSIQNGELEKNGSRQPIVYRSRAFVRQTWGFGGEPIALDSGPMQLAKSAESRRLVVTAGNLAIIDIFDKNAFAGDVRQQFVNMNFLTYSAFDFAADARGYSWGAAAEYYHNDWAIRAGRFIGPRDPNQLLLNYSIMKFHGDQVEIEHRHNLLGQTGAVRILAFRNTFNQGRFDEAIQALQSDPTNTAVNCTSFNYGSQNASAPDLCWVRHKNAKTGVGASLEQNITEDVGLFFRGMKTDGKVEVYAFTSTDSSVSFGSLIKGGSWGRASDTVGMAYARNWLSKSHVDYLNLGGIDGFIGDGKINYRPESLFEAFYNLGINKHMWITADYQRVNNPAYNADRGPVNVYGLRLHAEF